MGDNNLEDAAKAAMRQNQINKGGRIATRADLLHLRDENGDIIPKDIEMCGKTWRVRPACIGVLNRIFPGAIWGRAIETKVDMKLVVDTMARHVILEDGPITGDELMDALKSVENLQAFIEKWFEISGLKVDEATISKAKELGIKIGDDPNSQRPATS